MVRCLWKKLSISTNLFHCFSFILRHLGRRLGWPCFGTHHFNFNIALWDGRLLFQTSGRLVLQTQKKRPIDGKCLCPNFLFLVTLNARLKVKNKPNSPYSSHNLQDQMHGFNLNGHLLLQFGRLLCNPPVCFQAVCGFWNSPKREVLQ